MQNIVRWFEHTLYAILLLLLGIILTISVIDLGWLIITSVIDLDHPFLTNHEILSIFSLILFVLIGIEFFDSILTYFRTNVIHVEVIVLIAMIAVARKIIIQDTSESGDLHLIGLGILILCLGISYYLVKKGNSDTPAGDS